MTPTRPAFATRVRLGGIASASRRSRARRAVAFGLGFVLLVQVGLNVALDTTKPEWRDPEYGHRVKRVKSLVAANPGKPLVVVLGSSRPQMGLSPTHLGLGDNVLAFNHSQAGCGPIGELLTLRRLLADGVKPDFVLVEILAPVLGGEGDVEKIVKAETLSARDVGRLSPYCTDANALRLAWAEHRLNPVWNYRKNLVSHNLGGWLRWQDRVDFMWTKMDPYGWLPYFFDEIPPEKRANGIEQARQQYAGYFADFHLAKMPQRAYRDLLDECRARGIRVAFFVMPESPTFRSWYTPAAQTSLASYFDELRREAPLFDCRDWFDDETQFADGHHMMRHGAEAFSRRFGSDCVRPWLK